MPQLLLPDTTHAIQLAIAPAFVLAAIGSTLAVLTNRLARIDDHAEKLRDTLRSEGGHLAPADERILQRLNQRARLIHVSISAAVVCGLLICALVIATFSGSEFGWAVDSIVALLFVGAMVGLAVTYAVFLWEVYLGGHMQKPDRPLSAK